jgi:hypothetical protein
MKLRKYSTQEVAASKASVSVSTARRIENERHQLKKDKRNWRTRADPLAPIWDSVVLPLLKQDADITPIGIFDHLCDDHADKFNTSSRRTLERRISKWRHLHGPAQDVMFLQIHELGKQGICDFTHVQMPVTIDAKPFKHMLFNYRLPYMDSTYFTTTI